MTSAAFYSKYSMSLFIAISALCCRSSSSELIDVSSVGLLPVSDRALSPRALAYHLRTESDDVTYAPASAADAQIFGIVVPKLWRLTDPHDPELEHLNALAEKVGFALERWQVLSDVYVVLRELPDRRRGGGIYVFRVVPGGESSPGAAPAIVLQAPHIYHDVGTAELAQHAFFAAKNRTRIRALYMSSLHRYQVAPGKRRESGKSPADVSHNFSHLFNIVTRITAEHASPLYVVQLHGFDERDDGDASVEMVVSASTPALAEKTASALKRRFLKRSIRQYPGEFAELGGDSNAQRKLLVRYAGAEFVHLEMSRPFRNYLLKRSKPRGKLVAALVESVSAHAEEAGRGRR